MPRVEPNLDNAGVKGRRIDFCLFTGNAINRVVEPLHEKSLSGSPFAKDPYRQRSHGLSARYQLGKRGHFVGDFQKIVRRRPRIVGTNLTYVSRILGRVGRRTRPFRIMQTRIAWVGL